MGTGWSNYFTGNNYEGRASTRPVSPSRNRNQPPYVYPPGYHITPTEEDPGTPEPEVDPQPPPSQPDPEPVEPVQPVQPSQPVQPAKPPLKVKSVDYHIKENARRHNTDEYDLANGFEDEDTKVFKEPELIVRRGENFDITLKFDRKYDKENDFIHMMLEIGPQPKESKNTLIHMDLDGIFDGLDWGSELKDFRDNEVTVVIKAGADCIIGIWQFIVHTSIKSIPKEINRYVNKHPIYILFNAWCKDDQVYLDDEVERDEYVLHDSGNIFTGSARAIGRKPWNFGQFDDNILDCAMYLIDRSRLSYQSRGDPVFVSRAISQIVNSSDDSGVLTGNWSGNYEGGAWPTSWVGSVKILEQYYKTKSPVKFGQCWVFSGVTTTVSRALGLPTRSVTNFGSAHDTDGTVTIDKHVDAEGESVKHLDSDSIWNFHVWNEAWMKRWDVPNEYSGWQAFDATPQESSDGLYRAGPASIIAIKEGDINTRYDAGFIFAEINADVIYWGQSEDGRYNKMMRIDRKRVGNKISTNRPRKNPQPASWFNNPYRESIEEWRLDVTGHYKHPEYSENERAAVYRANQNARRSNDATNLSRANTAYRDDLKVEDVKFELKQKDGIMIGSVFNVVLSIQNTSRETRNVHVKLACTPVYYTGVTSADAKPIKSQSFNIELPPVKTREATMRVTMDDYIHRVIEQATFEIDVFAKVVETDQEYPDTELYRLRRPDLVVSAPEVAKVGQTIHAVITLESPMPVHLTECEWDVEGAHLLRPKTLPCAGVDPYGHVQVELDIIPKQAGERELMASFTSKELQDITGYCIIYVKE